eukprot:m.925220 g.925220  ORF g.925220 m.925220 type:complete len:229 (-) comp128808_c0_seq1:88-774(-)
MQTVVLAGAVALLAGAFIWWPRSVDCQAEDFLDTLAWADKAVGTIHTLQFADPNWDRSAFIEYLIQDGFYLQNYSAVVSHLHSVCGEQAKPLYDGLHEFASTFSLDDYAQSYGLNYTGQKPSNLLHEYFVHYEQQQTCADVISSMIPCLCVYPAIDKKISQNIGPQIDTIDPAARTWLIDNDSRHSCELAQCVLTSLSPSHTASEVNEAVYEESMLFEMAVFSNSPRT